MNGEAAGSVGPRFADWVPERTLPTFSTNLGAPEIGFQRWRLFKEAFAPELVKQAVHETSEALGRPVTGCADPFGGSGTTAITCQFLGVHPTTIEVNPFLADLIEAKLAQYDFASLTATYLRILGAVDRIPPNPDFGRTFPATFIEPGQGGKFLFWADVAARFCQYLGAITSQAARADERRLFKALLSACAVKASNAVISGKGRRYRRGWEANRIGPPVLDEAFRQLAGMALFDIRRFTDRACRNYLLIRGDAREKVSEVYSIDLAVFSPPYPNSFDYTDVYNIELWMGGYLGAQADNRTLRELTIRSHVQISRPFDVREMQSPSLVQCYRALCDVRAKLWNRAIPEMVPAYFDDMKTVMRGLTRRLAAGGRMYLVVGDSRYAGVNVPVARILAEEAELMGLEVLWTEPMRSMRTSPQQGGREELAESLLVFGKPA